MTPAKKIIMFIFFNDFEIDKTACFEKHKPRFFHFVEISCHYFVMIKKTCTYNEIIRYILYCIIGKCDLNIILFSINFLKLL